MELTGQKWANIKQGSSIFGKTLISLRRLPFGVNVMLNLSIYSKRQTPGWNLHFARIFILFYWAPFLPVIDIV